MIRAFWQSKLAAAAVAAASLAIVCLVWVRNAGRPVYIPIVATVLAAGLGVVASRLVGNLVANSQNVKRLGLLHMELDPEAFLRSYAQVPEKLPKKGLDYAVTRAYLADGHAAAGEFDKAIELLVLSETCKNKKQLAAMQGMYWQKLCSCQLGKGDVQEAKKSLQALDTLIAENGSARETLVENLKDSRRLLQNRLAAQTNKQVEKGWLEGQLKKAPYKLLRLEIVQTQAIAALRDGESEKAAEYLDLLVQEGGKTFYPRWAEAKKAGSNA